MPAGDMDSEYAIGVENRFAINIIDNDMLDDPLELIRAAQEKPKKVKEPKSKAKKDVKPAGRVETTLQSPTDGKRPENSDRPRGRGRGGGRGGRGGERGRGRGRGGGFGGGFGSSNPSNDENSDNQSRRAPRGACHRCGEEGHFVRECPQAKSPGGPQNDGGSPSGGFGAPSGGFGAPSGGFGAPSDSFGAPSGGFGAPSGGFGGNENEERRGGRGGFRGGRGGRGSRGGRGGRGGGREFDRRSGSDKSSVKAFEKKDGSGSYNWGTAQDELAASEEQQTQGFGAPKDAEETPTEDTHETQEGSAGEDDNKENTEAEAAQQMTFEDYKKQQEENRTKPQFNIRKANEGEQIKGMKELKKPTEKDNEQDGDLFFPTKYIEEKLKTSGRTVIPLNVNIQYATGDNRLMDTGRRGRGRGGRGGRGRGKDDPTGNANRYQLEDKEHFPSL